MDSLGQGVPYGRLSDGRGHTHTRTHFLSNTPIRNPMHGNHRECTKREWQEGREGERVRRNESESERGERVGGVREQE